MLLRVLLDPRPRGEPAGARIVAGHAGVDSSAVRPIVPGNGAPDGTRRSACGPPRVCSMSPATHCPKPMACIITHTG